MHFYVKLMLPLQDLCFPPQNYSKIYVFHHKIRAKLWLTRLTVEVKLIWIRGDNSSSDKYLTALCKQNQQTLKLSREECPYTYANHQGIKNSWIS